MYSVAVADDEPIICNGIKKMIESQNENFTVVKSFFCGEDLLAFLEENVVDVVFTDIMMNKVSGLDIAKYIHQNKPHISCVIISGYEKFEYAKKAMDYGVKSYLLKPLNPNELSDLLMNLEKQQKSTQEEFFKSTVDYTNLTVRQLVTDIFTGTLNEKEEIKTRAALVPGNKIICEKPLCIMKICVSDYESLVSKWKYDKEQLTASIYNFLCRELSDDAYLISAKEKIIILGFFNLSDKNRIMTEINHSKELFTEIFTTDFTEECVIKNNLYEIYNDSKLFSFFSEERKSENLLWDFIITKLNSDSFSEVENLFHSMYSTNIWDSAESYCTFVIKMFVEIFSKLSSIGINLPKHIYQSVNYSQADNFDTFEKTNAWSIKLLRQIYDNLNEEKNSDFNIIKKVEEYITNHLNEDISLDDISGYVYLNPIYFSRCFKKSTGENFSSYLVRRRIEEAKKLLSDTNMKVYQIGQKVGFGSTYYFNRVFKHSTGLTPNEFRKGE